MMFVYLVFKQGQVVYVGQTTQTLAQRKGKHVSDARKGRGSVLGAAIRKHSESSFAWIQFKDCYSQKELDEAEINLIEEFKPRYNLQSGGKSSFEPWNKGKKEYRQTALQNISSAAKSRKKTKRGIYKDEHKAKISNSGLASRSKLFVCNETGEIFYNQVTCANKMGLNARSLAVLLGKHTRLTSLRGYTFSYLDSAQLKPTLIDLEILKQDDKAQGEIASVND